MLRFFPHWGKKKKVLPVTTEDIAKLATHDDVGKIEENLVQERRSMLWNSLDKRTKFQVLQHAVKQRGGQQNEKGKGKPKTRYHLF